MFSVSIKDFKRLGKIRLNMGFEFAGYNNMLGYIFSKRVHETVLKMCITTSNEVILFDTADLKLIDIQSFHFHKISSIWNETLNVIKTNDWNAIINKNTWSNIIL